MNDVDCTPGREPRSVAASVKSAVMTAALSATRQERADRQDDGQCRQATTARRAAALLHDSETDRDPSKERRGPNQHVGGNSSARFRVVLVDSRPP